MSAPQESMPQRSKPPKRAKAPGCEKCNYRGLIFNTMLKKSIPCPHCLKRRVVDNRALRDWSAAEARRAQRGKERDEEIAKLMTEPTYRAPELDPYFAPTDRILQRWAAGQGSGLPDPDIDPQSRPPRLDDPTQVVVDQIVQRSEDEIRRFVREWYCSPIPVVTMAKLRGIGTPRLHDMHESVLMYLKACFERSGHEDLTKLLTGRL